MARRRPVIAVDGPAGAGKSTVARLVAKSLGLLYLDTGAMYRALALQALRHGVDLRDEEQLVELLRHLSIQLATEADGEITVRINQCDVSDLLRSPEVNASVSQVAGFSQIREEMIRRQRFMAEDGGIVMDGRDIGTYVLPDADLKFFLTASLEARARRRGRDLERMGFTVSVDTLADEIRHRDALDENRLHSPLKRAPDAHLIDTTDMEVEDVVNYMIELCRHHIYG